MVVGICLRRGVLSVIHQRADDYFSNLLSGAEVKDILESRVQFMGGTTYASAAFEKAISELSHTKKADDTVQLAVVFTDGFIADDISKSEYILKVVHKRPKN